MTKITTEQRDALNIVANLGQAHDLSQEERHALSKIIDALPDELTIPQEQKPSEPNTLWIDTDDDFWFVNSLGELRLIDDTGHDPQPRTQDFAPFRQIVPQEEAGALSWVTGDLLARLYATVPQNGTWGPFDHMADALKKGQTRA